MRDFRHIMEQFSALQFVAQEIDFCSSLGRQAMLDTPWMNSMEEVNENLQRVEKFKEYLTCDSQRKGIEELELVLCELVNINGSIQTIRQPGAICTDIDFFEIKKLALIEEKAGKIEKQYSFVLESKPSLTSALQVLDPEGERLPTFYLSAAFDPELGVLRKEQEQCKDEVQRGEIADKVAKLEDRVRERVTGELSQYADSLSEVLSAFAVDILALAKAHWAIKSNATRPIPKTDGCSIVQKVVHPEVQHSLGKKGMDFQPVSITFDSLPTLITGANMAGKSVLLSSIALCQILMQYGWFVPAELAELPLVDEVMMSVGDGQDISHGLSSFGSEMMRLDAIIKKVKAGEKVLALIDEPGRSTNPTEGHALVTGLARLLKIYNVRSLITTHYSNIDVEVKRWRVRGFVEERLVQPLSVNQLNQCIDYSLEEDDQDLVPQEAFRIARILGVDEELLEMCKV